MLKVLIAFWVVFRISLAVSRMFTRIFEMVFKRLIQCFVCNIATCTCFYKDVIHLVIRMLVLFRAFKVTER